MRPVLTLFLLSAVTLALAQQPMRMETPHAVQRIPAQATAALTDLGADIVRLQAGLSQAGNALAQGASMYHKYDEQLGRYLQVAANAARGDAGALRQLPQLTQQMQETQMSFNLQYLQLQSKMQTENRQYTAISNVMKTRHDTVKNSIGNIR